jgi:hypothetical protein
MFLGSSQSDVEIGFVALVAASVGLIVTVVDVPTNADNVA